MCFSFFCIYIFLNLFFFIPGIDFLKQESVQVSLDEYNLKSNTILLTPLTFPVSVSLLEIT